MTTTTSPSAIEQCLDVAQGKPVDGWDLGYRGLIQQAYQELAELRRACNAESYNSSAHRKERDSLRAMLAVAEGCLQMFKSDLAKLAIARIAEMKERGE